MKSNKEKILKRLKDIKNDFINHTVKSSPIETVRIEIKENNLIEDLKNNKLIIGDKKTVKDTSKLQKLKRKLKEKRDDNNEKN